MSFDLNQYRAAIGLYNCRSSRTICHSNYKGNTDSNSQSFFKNIMIIVLLTIINLCIIISLITVLCHSQSINGSITYNLMIDLLLFFNAYFFIKMLMMSGDVHKNPEPKDQSKLSKCHWKLVVSVFIIL